MLVTLFTVALFVAASIRGVSAAFAVSSPQLVQCKYSNISWQSTHSPSYNLIVARAEDMCGDPLLEIGDFNVTKYEWLVKILGGTKVYLSVMDTKQDEAWSSVITVGKSNDASCLPGYSGSPSKSSTSPSPSPSSGNTPDPLGAANAGTLGSSSDATAHQISIPVLAIAGLAVVVALL